MKKPRILLTVPYGPNELKWGEDPYDLANARLARGHGFFKMGSHMHYFALYLLAENISFPTTVLENPHFDEFERELDVGYDYVGIQIKSLHTTKVARMVKAIRKKSPDTKIIIGGYGVSALGYSVPGDVNGDAEYIRENADYLCREEGVRFMRRILEDEPIDREITQYTLPMCDMSLPGANLRVKTGNILVALGCPNACDFCNTSAFFHHKKIYVAEPEQVYRFMKHNQKRLKSKEIFLGLYDEDMFINADYVRELGKLILSDKNTWGINWFTFGSARSLAQFTAEELRDYGVGQIWIGVESFMSDQVTSKDYYTKRSGESIKKLFADLHSHGISTVGSLILGLDFHTPENIKEDIDQFVALKPTLYQISPLTPCPGTPLYDRMLEEDRILPNYEWKDFHLWKDDVFELNNFKPGEIRGFFDYAHEQIRDTLGPPAMQFMESHMDAYQSVKDKGGEFYAYKATQYKNSAMGSYAMMHSLKRHHPSNKVKERALMLERRYRDEIGEPNIAVKAASRYISGNIRKKSMQAPKEVISDPPPRWTYYNTTSPGDQIYVKKGRKAKKAKPYKNSYQVGMARF